MSNANHDPEDFQEEMKDDTVIAVALKRSALILVLLAGIVAITWFFLSKDETAEVLIERQTISPPEVLNQEVATRPDVLFQKMETGVDFVHFNGAAGEKLLPETMGGGVAVFDYDGDGFEDLFFTNSKSWPNQPSSEKPTQKLYRNDGSGNFQDVTAKAGLDIEWYAMGVAVGDVDNDGDADLFLSAVGENRFFLNQNGVFTDATQSWALAGESSAWSTSAGFFDYDNDGDLDLFVCNYVVWNRDIDLELGFTLNGKDRAYGPPKQYGGSHSYLYRNDGSSFTDVSSQAGIEVENPATGTPMGKALAVTFSDLDNDGFLDILVANDTVQNFVFHNQGNGTFLETGAQAGIAFDSQGLATGAMGMDSSYFANDSRIAVTIANFANESTSLFVQQPGSPWQFADLANSMGIGSPSRLKLSFGLFFFDYDLDGNLDLLQANGHLEEEINTVQSSQFYRQSAQLFWNTGGNGPSQFVLAPEKETGDLAVPLVGRAAAFGDFDGDGDLDVVLTQSGGAPLLLRNQQQLGHHWLKASLIGKISNRDAIGAIVSLKIGSEFQKSMVMPTRSYLSQVSPTLTFGLGNANTIDELKIRWPDGQEEVFNNISADQLTVFKQQTAAPPK